MELQTAPAEHTVLVAAGLRLSTWFERWFPDAFSLAMLAAIGIFAASLAVSGSVTDTAMWFGAGFWDLIAFTLQMAMVIVTGHALASAPPVFRAVRRLARVPATPRGAVTFVALFSMLSSLLSWSLCIDRLSFRSACYGRAAVRRKRLVFDGRRLLHAIRAVLLA